MTDDELRQLQQQLRQHYIGTTDAMLQSVRAWNELMMASTDLAFDVVLRNWDYSRSLRNSTEQAIADAIKIQQRMNREMLQAWEGYSSEGKENEDRGTT